MLRVAPPIPTPAPGGPSAGGGNGNGDVRQVTSVCVARRSQRRKRVVEHYEEEDGVFGGRSSASKRLFSSRGDFGSSQGRRVKEVVVKSEVGVGSVAGKVIEGLAGDWKGLVKAEELVGGGCEWSSLGVGRAELCLDLTLLTGQSFRWRKTGVGQFTGVVGAHLVSLRQVDDDVEYCHHASSVNGAVSDVEKEVREYLNLDTSLVDLYAKFTAADARFAAVAPFIGGARLLRQPPLECVFQFICSSNNHIQRITTMVDYLSSRGPFLGSVNGIRFHQFPLLEDLLPVTESQLRENGFGYRAKYIVGTAEMLRQKAEGGEQWLLALRGQSLEEAVTSLCTLPGIGPKVAACIALFSLDQHHAIPVDTHVWQIAVRYLLPELEGRKLTVKLHREVAEAFVQRFGSYAGWAHTVLFIAELSSQQGLLPLHLRVPKKQSVKASK
ncbi:hypothetical protein KC19_10G084800 [Ceratodon purpureus]|uniref:DNA-(apurinic or apyrimidinic site) lyase n=1 Tax=Ceratodon purpureus TaxID=3225 RepID=A0A8T0GJK0_CERPU|nr:hypothetical protein KC19_10G084800 [Ceratodon purpureus]